MDLEPFLLSHFISIKKSTGILPDYLPPGIITVRASTANNRFCANEDDNMCQWFNQQKEEYPNVQSLQLEIKKTGFRGEKEDADKTADIIVKTLSELLNIQVPVGKSAPKTKGSEEKVDEKLVQKAYEKISDIFGKHFYYAMEEVGRYLIKTFYGNDPEAARQGKAVKGKSFRQLVLKIQKNNDGSPSKTYLYNAIDLAVDIYDFANKKDFPYRDLGHSHKVRLTYVRDKEVKKALIQEAHDKKYTVKQLNERIAEINGKELLKLSFAKLPPIEVLKTMPFPELQQWENIAQKEIGDLREKIEKYQEKEKHLKEIIEGKSIRLLEN